MRVRMGLLVFVLSLVVTGCVSLQQVSSGQIGCPSNEIRIVSEESGWGTRTWTAECHGKLYYCSAHGASRDATPQVTCKEKAGEKGPEGAGNGGCQNDTQCKGDRVCRSGSCVDSGQK